MAIVNRDLFSTQQREVTSETVSTVTGQTYGLYIVPFPSQLIAAQNASIGLSGAPVHSLWIQRFIVGTGVTSIPVGNSQVITTFGTSGAIGFSLAGAGVTYPLQTGDLLTLSTAAANTATTATTVTMVIQCLQDIKSHFGL